MQQYNFCSTPAGHFERSVLLYFRLPLSRSCLILINQF